MGDVVCRDHSASASPLRCRPGHSGDLVVVCESTARRRGAFLAGWVCGVTVGALVFVLLTEVIELADEPPTWASWTRIVLGWLLIAVGLRRAQPFRVE